MLRRNGSSNSTGYRPSTVRRGATSTSAAQRGGEPSYLPSAKSLRMAGEDLSALPAEVRPVVEAAMRAASSGTSALTPEELGLGAEFDASADQLVGKSSRLHKAVADTIRRVAQLRIQRAMLIGAHETLLKSRASVAEQMASTFDEATHEQLQRSVHGLTLKITGVQQQLADIETEEQREGLRGYVLLTGSCVQLAEGPFVEVVVAYAWCLCCIVLQSSLAAVHR